MQIQSFSCHLESHALMWAYKFLVQICCLCFVVPVLNYFCPVLGSLCCWRCTSFINCKYTCSFKTSPKCLEHACQKVLMYLWQFFSTKTKLILKTESCKNHIAEYQAHKTALKSMHQSQLCIRAGSKCLCHKKSPEESHRCKQANLKCPRQTN